MRVSLRPAPLTCLVAGLALALCGCGSSSRTRPATTLAPLGEACPEQYGVDGVEVDGRCVLASVDPPGAEKRETGSMLVRTRRGALRVQYDVVDGLAIAEGDIILGPVGKVGGLQPKTAGRYDPGMGRIDGWVDCEVPYTIEEDVPDHDRIEEAMATWSASTCVRFVPRTTEEDYVTIRRKEKGCSATVGKVGGQQFVYLGDKCTAGKTLHEIGHMLGLWHEQARSDRDDHLIVNWDSIRDGHVRNFYTYVERDEPGFDHGEWDFDSVMHYGSHAFSADGEPTITKLDGTEFKGQRAHLSEGDVATVEAMYAGGDPPRPPRW